VNKGLNFRIECGECGRTFLTPDRRKKICPRCLGKVEKREEWRKREKEAEEKKKAEARKRAAVKPRPAPAVVLTKELQKRIFNEYEPYRHQEGSSWRKIHGAIALRMKIPKRVVGDALKEERSRLIIPQETQREITRRYHDYVVSLERPPKGRRKTIAADLGITFRAVAETVRDWKSEQSSVRELNREQRFRIEKAYFQALGAGRPLADLAEELAGAFGTSSFHILRYLDLIHDGIERFKKVPEATPEEREKVLSAYAEYLAAASPPEPFLHNFIAANTGVTPQTVHKTLLQYRLERLREGVF
jgi:hypothetical protein